MLQITISKRAALIIGVALLLVIPGVAGATHIFTDVVDGSTHAPGIEWVADNGVSTGCGDGSTYCPNDAVTRAQMGTFMCRLSGNCGVAPSVDAATAIDADTVDSYHANELIRFSGDSVNNDALVGVSGIAATAEITAPGPGFLVISASSDTYITGSNTDNLWCEIEVDATLIASSQRVIDLDSTTGNSEENCSTDAFYTSLFGGVHTVDFVFNNVGANSVVDETVLNVLFVPFNGEGEEPELIIVLP